jgi:hypothetical protein
MHFYQIAADRSLKRLTEKNFRIGINFISTKTESAKLI